MPAEPSSAFALVRIPLTSSATVAWDGLDCAIAEWASAREERTSAALALFGNAIVDRYHKGMRWWLQSGSKSARKELAPYLSRLDAVNAFEAELQWLADRE